MHETSLQPLDPQLLDHIGDLNSQLLELLSATARGQKTGLASPVVDELRAHWLQLSSEALRRLAACPYLLLELELAALHCHNQWTGIHEPAPASDRIHTAAPKGPLAELAQRALMMTWHYAQTAPVAARITLGLTATDCSDLAALSITGLERLAAESSARPRLRWEGRVEIWRQLLVAAVDGEQRRLRQLQLRGVQLLAAQNLR